MKLKSTLLLFALAIGIQANAQSWVTDSVEMGTTYANDIYYNISNGNDVSEAANNWDIAFQTTRFGEPMFNASIRANHNKRNVEVYSLHKVASVDFGNLTATDTIVTYGSQLLNEDTSWGKGAFTTNKSANPIDYGWGEYDMNTHNLNGDSLYLVKAAGVFYQLWIQKYVSTGNNIGYWFRVAKWDGTNDVSDSLMRVAPYTDRLFAYYDFATGKFTDREPSRKNWHIMFTQYLKDRVFGANPNKYQNYVGVLSNLKVEVAEITGVSPNAINSANYTASLSAMSKNINEIGDDWKVFNSSTFMYDLDTNTSFIIKPDTANGQQEYYHLQFTRFDGTSSGKIVFKTRTLAMVNVGINNVTGGNKAAYSIYPNPATTNINIVVDANDANNNTIMMVADVTGKVLQRLQVNLKKGINAFSLDVATYPTGTYIVTVANSSWKVSDKVVVQH